MRTVNTAHDRIRAVGELANATLKSRRLLRKLHWSAMAAPATLISGFQAQRSFGLIEHRPPRLPGLTDVSAAPGHVHRAPRTGRCANGEDPEP
ncbi:hypothetical protein GCM10023335_56170 [Streptomyces siamensis]|uniref:Transposase n=1 Tax=Streptomyces siamensis TaxID=1274986 RepID=A0ABP9J966_9ACTN